MKAHLPKNYLQVRLHQKNGVRLCEFIRLLLTDLNLDVDEIGSDIFDCNQGLLILATRLTNYEISEAELNYIYKFVSEGGSLFHLSNHSPHNKMDSIIGKKFGYEFQDYWVESDIENSSSPPTFSVKVKKEVRDIFLDSSKKFEVINGTSVVGDKRFDTIAEYGPGAKDCKSGKDMEGTAFSVRSRQGSFTGKIVAMGDSGLIGKPMQENPGPGLSAGDNKQLIKEIIKWIIY